MTETPNPPNPPPNTPPTPQAKRPPKRRLTPEELREKQFRGARLPAAVEKTEMSSAAAFPEPVKIIQRCYAKAAQLFEMYCEGKSLSVIATKFNMDPKEAAWLINHMYAFKMRHDPSLRRICRDQVKSAMHMLMQHYFQQAMGGGKQAQSAAKIFLQTSQQILEHFYIRKPDQFANNNENSEQPTLNITNIVGAEPFEILSTIKQRIQQVKNPASNTVIDANLPVLPEST